MKNRILLFLAALTAVAVAGTDYFGASRSDTNGLWLGSKSTDKIGFHGKAPVAQRTSASQAALTDSTGGTAGTTLAAGTGVSTVTVPLSSLATGLSTSALDITTNYVPGYAFKILKMDWVTTIAGTGSGATQTFNLKIGSTNVTGGVVNPTLASTATAGSITSGTAVTANNTGLATDTLSLKMAASGTVFTAGAGYFVIEIQNLDTANTAASVTRLTNELRNALVEKGLIKGS